MNTSVDDFAYLGLESLEINQKLFNQDKKSLHFITTSKEEMWQRHAKLNSTCYMKLGKAYTPTAIQT